MPTPGTKSHQPMYLGMLSPYGESEIVRLMNQRRVFDHLDWWSPHEWLNSDAFCTIASEESIEAAVLAVPVSFEDIDTLRSSRSSAAWLRWCAVADGVPAARVLRPVIEFCNGKLQQSGITDTYCIVEPVHWLFSYLRDAGFERVDDVITMICRVPIGPFAGTHNARDVHIRHAVPADIDQLCEVDAGAFEEQWHYPPFVLRRALASSSYFTVAEKERQLIGYQFATCYDDDAHITRLAVRPDFQGQGVGTELLDNVLSYVKADSGLRVVTLNTQASNQVSQRLYSRFGFEVLQPSLCVMCKHNVA